MLKRGSCRKESASYGTYHVDRDPCDCDILFLEFYHTGQKMAGDIEKPMVALADRLQSFAQGDLVSEFPECNTEDEIAYMIRVAKEMADNLNLIITDAGELLGQMADGNYAIGTKIEEKYVGQFGALKMQCAR